MENRANRGTILLRLLSIMLSTALVGGLTYGSHVWVTALVRSLYTYRTPLRAIPLTHQTTRPLVTQVVIVVVSGLRQDLSERMPTLNSLRDQGASLTARIQAPTYAETTWTTLLTGAGPEINDADLLADLPNELTGIMVDHIFDTAHRVGLSAGLAGHQGWERLLPLANLDVSFVTGLTRATGDREVTETALRLLEDFRPNLLLIHLNQLGQVSSETGGLREDSYRAALRVDTHLRDIADALDLGRSCLIVTSDHGQTSRGGYGGNETEVTAVPLVMAGKGIKRVSLGSVEQRDIAPTVAALLGMPVPGVAQGQMVENALDLTPETRAEKLTSYATQRTALANHYLAAIDGAPLSETARGDAAVAKSSLEVGNYRGASQLATFSLVRSREEMVQQRDNRLSRERLNRAPVSMLAILIPLYLLLRKSSGRSWYLFFCATVVVLIYHGSRLWRGDGYSLSSLRGFRPLVRETLDRAAVSSGIAGLLALGGILIEGEESLLEIWRSLLGFGLQTCYLLTIPVALAFGLNGFALTWFIPDLTTMFVQIESLLLLALSGAILIAWPIPFVLIGLVIRVLLRIVHRMVALMSSSLETVHAHRRNR